MKTLVPTLLILLCIPMHSAAQDTVQKALWLEIGYRTTLHKGSMYEAAIVDYNEDRWSRQPRYRFPYPEEKIRTYSQELYVQATFQNNKWFFPLQLGIMRWNEAIAGTRHVNLFSHYNNNYNGAIVEYREHTIDYLAVSYSLHLSTGIAWNALPAEGNFRFGPVLRINPTILLYRHVKSEAVIEHYRHYTTVGNPSIPKYNEETYTTSDNATDFLKFKSFMLNPSVGLMLGRNIGKIAWQIETGFSKQRQPSVSFGELHRQSNFYLQLGINYQLQKRR